MLMKAVAFTPAATRQWLKLSADIRKRIDGKLTIYATNGSGNVKRLKGTHGCRLRIGDWRLSLSKMIDHRHCRRQPQRDLRLRGRHRERSI